MYDISSFWIFSVRTDLTQPKRFCIQSLFFVNSMDSDRIDSHQHYCIDTGYSVITKVTTVIARLPLGHNSITVVIPSVISKSSRTVTGGPGQQKVTGTATPSRTVFSVAVSMQSVQRGWTGVANKGFGFTYFRDNFLRGFLHLLIIQGPQGGAVLGVHFLERSAVNCAGSLVACRETNLLKRACSTLSPPCCAPVALLNGRGAKARPIQT